MEDSQILARTGVATKHPSPSGVVMFVVNVSWFFLSHRLPLALEVKRRGMQVHLATQIASASDRARIAAAGIQLHEVSMIRGRGNLVADVVTLYELVKLYRRLRPDLVHQVTMKPVILGGIAARTARVRAVASAVPGLGYAFASRGLWATIRRYLLRALLRVAFGHHNTRVIFQNPDDAALMIAAGVINREKSVIIAGSGVDMDEYGFQLEVGGAVVRVLLAARMLVEKGVEDFVRAARALRNEGVLAEFLLAGQPDPDNPGSIPEQRLREWHDQGDVHWLGQCEDMPALLRSVHLVCLPSYYGEGVPRILIEAAAVGRPIVASDMPGCREIVRHELNGLLVPPRDVDALANALRQLIGDSARRVRFGIEGRRLAEANFSLDQVVTMTLRVYESLLGMRLGDAQ